MKTHARFMVNWFKRNLWLRHRGGFRASRFVLLAATAIVLVTVTTPAKGENYSPKIESLSIPDNVINGLAAPNQSLRFFQRGREAFEQEIKIFNHPERYDSDDILEIAPESVKRIKKLQPSALVVDDFDDFSQQR